MHVHLVGDVGGHDEDDAVALVTVFRTIPPFGTPPHDAHATPPSAARPGVVGLRSSSSLSVGRRAVVVSVCVVVVSSCAASSSPPQDGEREAADEQHCDRDDERLNRCLRTHAVAA